MTVSISPSSVPGVSPRPARVEPPRPQYLELKANVHRKLLNRLNLEALATAERSRAEAEIRTLLFELIAEEAMPLTMTEREAILSDVIDEVFGLGPLEPTGLSVASGAASMTARRWRTPGFLTGLESMPSSRRWRWTVHCCRSGASPPSGSHCWHSSSAPW